LGEWGRRGPERAFERESNLLLNSCRESKGLALPQGRVSR
jgi:hypothetical protein